MRMLQFFLIIRHSLAITAPRLYERHFALHHDQAIDFGGFMRILEYRSKHKTVAEENLKGGRDVEKTLVRDPYRGSGGNRRVRTRDSNK